MSFIPGLGQTGLYEIPLAIVLISIILSGIAIGVGLAIRSIRLENFGKEEFFQAIVNAALLGILASTLVTIDTSLNAFVTEDQIAECNLENTTGLNSSLLMGYVECRTSSFLASGYTLQQELSHSLNILAFLGDLEFDMGVVTSTPFSSMQYTSSTLSSLSQTINSSLILINLELIFIHFIVFIALPIFLPLGFIFRSFFVTRKIGAALIALAIAFYVIYPFMLFVSLPFFEEGSAIKHAQESMSNFNSEYSYMPLIDLNKEGAVVQSIQCMSAVNESSNYMVDQTYNISKDLTASVSEIIFFSVVIHLISFVITFVAAIQLYRILSAEFVAPVFEKL